MLRRVVHVVASAYIYIACFGLLVVASDWLGGRKGESADGDYSAGLWPLPPEQESLLASSAVTNPGKPPLRIIQTNLAAVHAGEALLKPPPAMKVVQANLAAVHAGETLLKRPPAMKVVQANLAAVHAGENAASNGQPAMKVVQANLAAVHAGETLLKRPPAMKVVQANLAAVHAGEALLKPPPAMKVVQANLAAVHAGETLIKASPPALVTAADTQIPTVQSVAIEVCRNQHGGNPRSPGPNSEAKDRTIVIAGECRQRRVDKRAGYAKLEEPAQGCSAVRPAQHQSEGRQEVSRTDGGRETQVHHGKGHRG